MTYKLVGQEPYQIPSNADLGTLAYQNADALQVGLVNVSNTLTISGLIAPLTVGYSQAATGTLLYLNQVPTNLATNGTISGSNIAAGTTITSFVSGFYTYQPTFTATSATTVVALTSTYGISYGLGVGGTGVTYGTVVSGYSNIATPVAYVATSATTAGTTIWLGTTTNLAVNSAVFGAGVSTGTLITSIQANAWVVVNQAVTVSALQTIQFAPTVILSAPITANTQTQNLLFYPTVTLSAATSAAVTQGTVANAYYYPTAAYNAALVVQNGGLGVTGNAYFANNVSVTGGLIAGIVTATNIQLTNSYTILGQNAGVASPGANSIAIGASAGAGTSFGAGAIAIGGASGYGTVGANAIMIGYGTGNSGAPSGSIFLNASGNNPGVYTNAGFYVNPVRADATSSGSTWAMYYNPISKEITTSSVAAYNGGTISNGLTINNLTATTGTQTGALVVTGGVGIAGGLFVGAVGTFTNAGASKTAVAGNAVQITAGGIGVNGNSYFGGDIGVATGSKFDAAVSAGGNYFSKDVLQVQASAVNSSGASIASYPNSTFGLTLGNSGYNFSGISDTGVLSTVTFHKISGPTLSSSAALFTVTNLAVLTINATAITTGTITATNNLSLLANGGVGVNGNMFVTGATAGDGGTNNGSGSLVRIQQNTSWSGQQPWALYVSGYTYLGGFRINGGDGVRALFLASGTLGFATGDTASPITFTTQNSSERMRIDTSGTVYINTTTQYSGAIFNVVGGAYITGAVTATNFYGLASTATNATNIIGGAPGSIHIQGNTGTTAFIPLGSPGQILTVVGSTASWTALTGLSAGSATTASNLTVGTAGQVPYNTAPGATTWAGPGTAGQVFVSNGTSGPFFTSNVSLGVVTATTLVATAVTATGVVINGAGTSTSSYTANALYVQNGIGAQGGIYAGQLTVQGQSLFLGAVTFSNNVTFSGTSTYVYSTNTVYTDNIIEVHTPQGGVNAQWTSDDGKDVGFRFHYYNRTLSTDSNAALILAADSQTLEWYGTGAESNTGTFTSATYGTFKLGAIKLVGGAGTNNATSGDLQVSGGVGIGGGLYVGGTLTATIHTSPTSLTFNVNNNSTAILVDANRNVLLGGATSVLNSVNAGAVVQLGDAGVAQTTLLNPWMFFNGKYSTAGGVPQYGGIWASPNYWGIGPDTNAGDNTVRIGTMTGGATGYQWNAATANLRIGTLLANGASINGIVTATTFIGTFIGTLSTIVSTASTVVTQVSNANALYYPTFVNLLNTSTNIGVVEYTTSSFTVNPSTGQVNIGSTSTATMNALLGVNGNAFVNGILTATNLFVGPWAVNTSSFTGSAGFANTASSVIVQASNTTANYYPTFVSRNNLNTTTSEVLYTSSSFYINATSGAVTMGNATATNIVLTGVTNATSTVTGALQVAGGAGIGRDVQVGGNLYVNNGTQVIPTNIQEFAATGGQTTFTPIGGYVVGTVQVTANGIALGSGDFVASNGSTVVLNIARNTGDIIRIISGGTSSAVNNIKSFAIAMSVAMSM
jgi:hypothetical protein